MCRVKALVLTIWKAKALELTVRKAKAIVLTVCKAVGGCEVAGRVRGHELVGCAAPEGRSAQEARSEREECL